MMRGVRISMRLASPVYESLPLIYVAIGALAFLLAYVDPVGSALGDRVRDRIACADRGAHRVFAASGLPRSEPRISGRDHRLAVTLNGHHYGLAAAADQLRRIASVSVGSPRRRANAVCARRCT